MLADATIEIIVEFYVSRTSQIHVIRGARTQFEANTQSDIIHHVLYKLKGQLSIALQEAENFVARRPKNKQSFIILFIDGHARFR